MEQMGENIKLARKRPKLTPVKVSDQAGIARSTYILSKKIIPVLLWTYILMCFAC